MYVCSACDSYSDNFPKILKLFSNIKLKDFKELSPHICIIDKQVALHIVENQKIFEEWMSIAWTFF